MNCPYCNNQVELALTKNEPEKCVKLNDTFASSTENEQYDEEELKPEVKAELLRLAKGIEDGTIKTQSFDEMMESIKRKRASTKNEVNSQTDKENQEGITSGVQQPFKRNQHPNSPDIHYQIKKELDKDWVALDGTYYALDKQKGTGDETQKTRGKTKRYRLNYDLIYGKEKQTNGGKDGKN